MGASQQTCDNDALGRLLLHSALCAVLLLLHPILATLPCCQRVYSSSHLARPICPSLYTLAVEDIN
jgi:hypothetical protein